ncbi:hypothetical protein EF900_17410, partial [Staphylococcus aureus]
GAFCEYVSHPADFLYHLPDSVTYEQATLVEPFSVGLQACKRADIKPGSTVVIMGMGPVGLMAVVAAKAYGATNIIVSDLEDNPGEPCRECEYCKSGQYNLCPHMEFIGDTTMRMVRSVNT